MTLIDKFGHSLKIGFEGALVVAFLVVVGMMAIGGFGVLLDSGEPTGIRIAAGLLSFLCLTAFIAMLRWITL